MAPGIAAGDQTCPHAGGRRVLVLPMPPLPQSVKGPELRCRKPCNKYCDHCAGWVLPLMTKCGYYYVENIIGRKTLECVSVITPSKEIAEEIQKEYLASAVEENTVFSNLDIWEEVEKNKQ